MLQNFIKFLHQYLCKYFLSLNAKGGKDFKNITNTPTASLEHASRNDKIDTIKTPIQRHRMDCDIEMKVLLISNPTGAIREISLQDKRFRSSLNYGEFFYSFFPCAFSFFHSHIVLLFFSAASVLEKKVADFSLYIFY